MRSGSNWLTWPFAVIDMDKIQHLKEERDARRARKTDWWVMDVIVRDTTAISDHDDDRTSEDTGPSVLRQAPTPSTTKYAVLAGSGGYSFLVYCHSSSGLSGIPLCLICPC